MMSSLHTITSKAFKDYVTSPRTAWLLNWPGQVVLSVSQTFWTKAVEDALRSAGTEGLQKFAQECSDTLKSEVELVRGELTKLQRATLGAQVVIDVHARDVLAQMAKDGVCSDTDFAWQAQLRCVLHGAWIAVLYALVPKTRLFHQVQQCGTLLQ
jgi:dynein heavy chain, axonemal